MISICTTVKNRSRVIVDGHELLLFPNCVESIVESVGQDIPCELVVADWGSEDWPLNEWLQKAAEPVPVQVVEMGGPFSRGQGLNAAAKAAKGDVLFFVDADAVLCRTLLTSGLQYLREGKAYFPVLYSFDDAEHRSGAWMHKGYGHCMVTRAMYKRAGGWPEYDEYGKEDEDFFSQISSFLVVVREEVPGFYHQWHPTNIAWKNQYYSLFQLAIREMVSVLPLGATFILVDEAGLGQDAVPGRQALPFLEHEGQYWGHPSDDATAIRELERLRNSGASFIVFAWPAFWWLEYYLEFHQFLRSNFPCVLQNERLVVFNLKKQYSANFSFSGPTCAKSTSEPSINIPVKAKPHDKHYQPIYTSINPIGHLIHDGERKCIDRAQMIYTDLQTLGIASGSLLDIGCNIGFFCHYFQSRGYACTGYEDNSHVQIKQFTDRNSIEVARRLSIHYDVHPQFREQSALTLVDSDELFDIVLCLSVAHHWFIGYGYTDKDKLLTSKIENVINKLSKISRRVTYFEFGDVGAAGWGASEIPAHLKMITGAEAVKIGSSDGYEGPRVVWRLLRGALP